MMNILGLLAFIGVVLIVFEEKPQGWKNKWLSQKDERLAQNFHIICASLLVLCCIIISLLFYLII